jgi:hypothetical protein
MPVFNTKKEEGQALWGERLAEVCREAEQKLYVDKVEVEYTPQAPWVTSSHAGMLEVIIHTSLVRALDAPDCEDSGWDCWVSERGLGTEVITHRAVMPLELALGDELVVNFTLALDGGYPRIRDTPYVEHTLELTRAARSAAATVRNEIARHYEEPLPYIQPYQWNRMSYRWRDQIIEELGVGRYVEVYAGSDYGPHGENFALRDHELREWQGKLEEFGYTLLHGGYNTIICVVRVVDSDGNRLPAFYRLEDLLRMLVNGDPWVYYGEGDDYACTERLDQLAEEYTLEADWFWGFNFANDAEAPSKEDVYFAASDEALVGYRIAQEVYEDRDTRQWISEECVVAALEALGFVKNDDDEWEKKDDES